MSQRRFVLLALTVLAAGLVIHMPNLGAGFHGGDSIHQLVLEGETPAQFPLRPWNLHEFGTGKQWQAATADGGRPAIWWISPQRQVRFLRPLSSLSLWLDHVLWGSNPVPYHLSSMAWYLVVLVLVLALYRSLGLERMEVVVAGVSFSAPTDRPCRWPGFPTAIRCWQRRRPLLR